MKSLSNFERAKKLTEEWPAWKRDYQLTKNSEIRQERNVSEEKKLQGNEQAKTALPKTVEH